MRGHNICFFLKNKKNYLRIILNTLSYLELCIYELERLCCGNRDNLGITFLFPSNFIRTINMVLIRSYNIHFY